MALVRCDDHQPKGNKHHYSDSDKVKPFGYPDTAAICGIKGCKKAGMIWLDETEKKLYAEGERFFGVHTNAINVRAE